MKGANSATALDTTEKIYEPPDIEKEKIGANMEFVKGKGPQMQHIIKLVQKVAPTKSTVLILGETGTGKEFLARYLHSRSGRQDRPFFAINCAAFSENLIETELFGCEAGAYTDATKKRIGQLQAAEGGTVFLDEVEAASQALQQKILRVIESKEIRPVGSAASRYADIRFIAASNINLKTAVQEKKFREDLLYRLSISLTIPPLRRREEDIPLFVYHILSQKNNPEEDPWRISEEAMRYLQNRDWKGNIRELGSVLDLAVLSHFENDSILRKNDFRQILETNEEF